MGNKIIVLEDGLVARAVYSDLYNSAMRMAVERALQSILGAPFRYVLNNISVGIPAVCADADDMPAVSLRHLVDDAGLSSGDMYSRQAAAVKEDGGIGDVADVGQLKSVALRISRGHREVGELLDNSALDIEGIEIRAIISVGCEHEILTAVIEAIISEIEVI